MKFIILIFLFFALLVWAEFLIPPPSVALSLNGQLPSTSAKAIDTLIGLTSLMITFALALVGGIAFYARGTLKAEIAISPSARLVLLASGLSAIASIYFGHLVYAAVIDMLSNDFFTPGAAFLTWPARLQYVTLLSALMLFLIGAVRLSSAPQNSAPAEQLEENAGTPPEFGAP